MQTQYQVKVETFEQEQLAVRSNALGENGWELFAIFPGGDNFHAREFVCIFKRVKPAHLPTLTGAARGVQS